MQTLKWKVLEHDALHIRVQAEFSMPEMISVGSSKDTLAIEIKDYRLFKSSITGKAVELWSFETGTPEFTVTIE